jgi:hypothetical protein
MTGVGIFFANYFLSFFMSGDFIFATCKVCKLFLRIAKLLNVRSHLFVPDFFYLTPIFSGVYLRTMFFGQIAMALAYSLQFFRRHEFTRPSNNLSCVRRTVRRLLFFTKPKSNRNKIFMVEIASQICSLDTVRTPNGCPHRFSDETLQS